MKNLLWMLLLSITFPTTAAMAQNPPQDPAISEDLQKFLNTPVWYLNYKVTVKAAGSHSGDDGSSWSSTRARETNGTAQLGIRSQGPGLSLMNGTPPQGQEFFDMIPKFANWIGGVMTDESKSQEGQDAELLSVLMANKKAYEQFSLVEDSVFPGTGTEGGGTPAMEHDHLQESGNAEVACLGDFALEIDAAKKKYKFKFATAFVDSQQSTTAVHGESVVRIGAPDESHQPIETDMRSGSGDEIVSIDPQMNMIEGDLPASFGNLSGSPSAVLKIGRGSQEIPGTMTIQYTLSATPPWLSELIIIPPKDYKQWRPMGAKDEMDSGDWVPIKVKLQKKGGGDPQYKAARFTYQLKNTSREKGVCMNYPRIPSPDNPYDLQFESDQNQGYDIIGTDRQSAVQSGDAMTEGEVIVSSFDYGAYGDFEAFAELENGEVVHGVVQGTQEKQLKLPKRKDGSLIASVFLKDLGNLPDTDDSENDPVGDGYKGDGLSLYEEYRGFMDGDKWTPGDPKKKDVFVYNQMRGMPQVLRGINVFKNSNGLKVHSLLKDNEVNSKMVINFNSNAATHRIDQHVIRIQAGQTLAAGETAAFVEDVGTPGRAKSVHMPPDWAEYRTVGFSFNLIPSFERTLAHEMSHDCNIYHHGEQDKQVRWEYVKNPEPHIVEIDRGGRATITLKSEDGSTVFANKLFPPYTPDGYAYNDFQIGVQHGQHSGAEDCLMRYDIAWAYPSDTDPTVRYLSPGEMRGTALCTTKSGTGINASSHRPQSRYGDAATPANGGVEVKLDRGDCKHQLRVNDLGPEPER